jgi:hypothetical protein
MEETTEEQGEEPRDKLAIDRGREPGSSSEPDIMEARLEAVLDGEGVLSTEKVGELMEEKEVRDG